MALAPKLQLRQGQKLAITPQLRQAIKLLQLSNIELSAFVDEQLEKNPLLERGDGSDNRRLETLDNQPAVPEQTAVDTIHPSAAPSDIDMPAHALTPDASPADMGADVGGSIDWSRSQGSGSFNGSQDYDPAANSAAEISLTDHIRSQIGMLRFNPRDRLLAEHLIGQLDEAGYVRGDISDIAEKLNIELGEIEAILALLQSLEPTGVFARNLSECIALQLIDKAQYHEPMQILVENLELLARYDLSALAKKCGVTLNVLKEMITCLRKVSPKPGIAYGGQMAQAIEPDVYIRETPQGGWTVELNAETLPRVLLNHRYYNEIKSAGDNNEKAREFITECHQNASWLVKSLDQRARTILKVSSEIVRLQDGFFAYGINHLRPLKLKDVADAIEMHESTVSRVTSGKYMHTPRGLFELKYFFTASIPSLDGAEGHSAETVRSKIKILIDEETQEAIMSDDKIVKALRDQGIDIARRTVAKYREAMNISSSVERRRMFKHG